MSIHHCGLVYSNRNQALYGITVNGADNSWLLRIDTDTGAARTITQLSTDHDWSTAGMTYDELTDTIYVVSKPGIFQVDLDPALSGGDNVTLIIFSIPLERLHALFNRPQVVATDYLAALTQNRCLHICCWLR